MTNAVITVKFAAAAAMIAAVDARVNAVTAKTADITNENKYAYVGRLSGDSL
ncbi:MAG: hypothetical protein IKN17_02260 [Ruminococcus sp.]|nr:hypothetical protein [Ruminococcus sp.]